ncbi:MAG: glycosyltransferase family 39 protein [Bacteroidetes bacterium]|nr:glycosyltransferase family 39 protein [Bacteroidota bacterium]
MVIKFIKEHIVFAFVLLACIILRLMPLFNYQFTLDELSGIDRTHFNSFGELIEKGVKIDAHPALVQVLIYYISQFFGYTNWIIKLPFLLCSFGAVIYTYFFCLKNFSKQVANVAAVIFSFSLVFVFYAPIARMYISGVFFSIALLYYFFEIFFLHNYKKSNYFFLGMFALLSALNQHINGLFAFTVYASGLLFLNKTNFKAYAITLSCVILAYLPHLPVTFYQLSIGGIGYEQGGWLAKPEITSVLDFLTILFGTGKTYLIFLVLIVACFVLNKKINFNKKQAYLLIIFLVNYFVVYLYSVFNAPIFQNSVMLFSGVAMVVLISSLLDLKNKMAFNAVLAIIAGTLIFKSYYKKDYYHQCVRTVFEYQFERTVELKKNYGDENVYPIFVDCDEVMKGIYFKKYNSKFDCKSSADSITISLKYFSEFVASLKADYLVLASSYPLQQAVAMEYYPYLIENTQTQGINYKLYSNKKEDAAKVVEGESIIYTANLFDKKDLQFKERSAMVMGKTSFSLPVDSANEYPFDAIVALNKITSKEGQVILFKAGLKLNSTKNKVSACISMNDTIQSKMYSFNANPVGDFVIKKDSTITIFTSSYCGTDYKKIKDKAKCTAFIWNSAKETFSLTGFELNTIDYWPQKWNFWE